MIKKPTYEELEIENRDLKRLYEVATVTDTSSSLEKILQPIAVHITEVFNVSGCTILLWHREKNQIVNIIDYNRTYPENADELGLIYDLDKYPETLRALETNQIYHVQKGDPEADESELALMEEQEVFEILGLPLTENNQVLGLLEIYDDVELKKFTKQEIQLATALTSQAAIAVKNAQLYESAQSEIIKRKKTEESLKESEENLRSIFENMQDVFYKLDLNGKIIALSPSALELYNYDSLDEIIGKQADDFVYNNEDSIKLTEKLHKIGFLKNYIIKHKSKNGEPIYVETNSNLLLNDQGEPESVVGVFRDVTERKKAAEEKIRIYEYAAKQKKMALVGQIAGKMAHDFNNVLAVIMGNAQLALLDSKEAKTVKALELIFNQTIRGKNLTKNLVAFAKDQEPKQEFFKLNEKIELVLNLLKKELDSIDVIKEEGHGVPNLLADPGMLEHAFVNLVQNSIHAISMVKQPRIIIRTFHKDKTVYIEIEDNGCGIPEEVLDKIYEPAFTMKGSNDITNAYKPGIKGTGYGMANVKKYIEQHKGNIVINSKVWKGTTITIGLPVIKKEFTEKEIIDIKKETFYSEKYILLVEDELALSDIQYKILTHEPCNHKVDIAATGQMAIDLFDRNEYDFISLDYILPGGFNGMDVYDHVRKTNKTVPILFVSGNIEFLESIKELQHKDANVGHISKPCQNTNYVDSINKLLEHVLAKQ